MPYGWVTVSECREFFMHVWDKALEMRVPVSMAVVNPEGHLLALERMDEAGWLTAEIAYAKAFTVAAFRTMSPRFPDGLTIRRWFQERNPQMMINSAIFTNGKIVASGGSTPIFRGKELIGCFGISGGTSEQDEEMGRYARAKMGWASEPEE